MESSLCQTDQQTALHLAKRSAALPAGSRFNWLLRDTGCQRTGRGRRQRVNWLYIEADCRQPKITGSNYIKRGINNHWIGCERDYCGRRGDERR